MEHHQLNAYTMHALLLASLVTLSHWGMLGLSSAQDGSQVCCTELEMLARAFPEEEYECLVEDCISWLTHMRNSKLANATLCPVPEEAMCEKFEEQKQNNMTKVPNRDWRRNEHVTVRNILRVVDSDSHRWHNCVIVYDVTSWPVLLPLTSSLSNREIDFIIYNVKMMNDSSDLRTVLEEVFTNLGIREVIVMADVAFYFTLFREAEEYDRSLGRTSGLRMFTKWIVTTFSGLEEEISRAATYFDSVVAVIENQETIMSNISSTGRMECVLTEISTLMYIRGNDSRQFQTVLQLSDDDLIVNNTFPNTQFGFNTRTLLVGTKEWPPFSIKQVDDSGNPKYTGMCMDLLHELAQVLNFTYVIKEPPFDEGWGERNASGYWEGLVGQLYRKEVDLVVAPLSFSPERALAMDATYPFTTNNVAAVFKKPDPDADKWRTYLKPFRGEVLLCLGVTLLMITCLVHVMAWANPDNYSKKLEDPQGHRERTEEKEKTTKKKDVYFPGPSPDDGFWYLYGALLSQERLLYRNPKTAC